MKTRLPGHGRRVTKAAVRGASAAGCGLRVPWMADETRKPQSGTLGTHHASGNPGRAFTLIEIMVVVAIFGITLTMGVPSIYRVFHKESLRTAVNDIQNQMKTDGTLATIYKKWFGQDPPKDSSTVKVYEGGFQLKKP